MQTETTALEIPMPDPADLPAVKPVINLTTNEIVPPLVDDLIDEPEEIVVKKVTEVDPDARPNQNVTVEYPYSLNVDWVSDDITVAMPSDYDKETRKKIEQAPNVNLNDNPKAREWINTVSNGLAFTTEAEMFVKALEDENADYRQCLEHNGSKIGGAQPKFKESENQKLSGERGVIRIMSALGLGTLFNTPLWHTGIWVTFKAPTESEIVELNRMLVSDKVRFGRSTYSLAFSNLTSYTVDKLVNFALEHIYDCTLKNEEIGSEGLKAIISTQDIPSLLWGFVCTMYPKGFQYNRACINDPVKCNHIVEEKLNVSKLQWTNNAALTDWQKTHMAVRRANSKGISDVKRYKEELKCIQSRNIELIAANGATLNIIIKTPTVNEYIDSGHRWIGDIVALVDKTLQSDASEAERNNFIIKHGQASSMRQYAHWVESIEVNTNVIDDKDTIETTINMLSSDPDIRNGFIKEIVSYINASTVSVIGIPAFDCPKCSHPQDLEVKLPNHTNIIPLDVIQLFFVLTTLRLEKISRR